VNRRPNQRKKILAIHVDVFRVAVVVTWETNKAWVMNHARTHGIAVTEDGFGQAFSREVEDNECLGLCISFGDRNSDVLVWLRERPTKATDYGVLYHELYHAVDCIAESRHLKCAECRAFTFEYLVNQCNKFFWP